MENDKQKKVYTQIIAHRGSPTQATLNDGTVVEKEEIIMFKDVEKGFIAVRTIDYYDHFIYKTPAHWEGSPSFMCTCGSYAVLLDPAALLKVNYGEYPTSRLVCYTHALESEHYGFLNAKHMTSHVNKKDFEG